MFHWQPLVLVPLAGIVACAVVAWSGWRQRVRTPAGRPLALTMLALCFWAAPEVVSMSVSNPALASRLMLAIYPSVAVAVLATYRFCQVIVDRRATMRRRMVVLLLVEPVLVTIAAATNDWHGLLVTDIRLVGDPPIASIVAGPLFWLHSAYSYTLLIVGYTRVARARRAAANVHRRQLTTVLLGGLFPTAANVLTLVLTATGYGADLTVVGFTASGVVYWWAVFRQGMLKLVPVARSVVFEQVADAILVLDHQNRLLDLNVAAERLIRRGAVAAPADLIGISLGQLVPKGHHGFELSDGEHEVRTATGRIDLHIRSAPLLDDRSDAAGKVMVVRDITELKDKKRELARVNAELQEQVRVIDKLRGDLAELAARDELTGLHNRRHLMRTLSAGLGDVSDRSLSVVLVDIDHFKSVNDRFGHAVGDDVLTAVASMLAASARAGDTVARYGGEEFVVVLPDTTAGQALKRAEEWRARCADMVVDSGDGPISVTFSAGVASSTDCGTSPGTLLAAADRALYRAKADGRNRVLLDVPEPTPLAS